MSGRTIDLCEFGPHTLDVQRRLFTRDGQVVPLAPKTFDLLLLLVQSGGRALSKHELMSALWPDTFVEEANLTFQISTLRKALGESGAQWIETLPKHGYRFGADVRTVPGRESHSDEPVLSASAPTTALVTATSTKKKKWMPLLTLALLLIVPIFIFVFRPRPTEAIRPAAAAVPLTAYQGFENAPSLSPDGSQVAFSWNGPTLDNFDIYVKLVGPGEPIPVTKDPARDDNPSWSPDGKLIAFERFTAPDRADVYVVPALGGGERKVAVDVISESRFEMLNGSSGSLSWSPDGKWLAHRGGATEKGIWLSAVDGSGSRRLTETGSEPTFSEDGRSLAFVQRATAGFAVFVVPLAPGFVPAAVPKQVTPEAPIVRSVAWTPGGHGLIFSSSGFFGISRLQRLALTSTFEPTTSPELTVFGENATAVTVSKTGRLVYSAQSRDANIWKISLAGADRLTPVPLVSETFDDLTPDYSPDGQRLAFSSTRSGNEEIWIANADGSKPLQMTSMRGPVCAGPQWSPDGTKILFHSSSPESPRTLYLLYPNDGRIQRLTHDRTMDSQATWSRDGRLIYFQSDRTGGAQTEIWKMSANGQSAVQITKQGGTMAIESPDRRFLYYAKNVEGSKAIWRVPVNGGEETPVVAGLSDALNFAVGDQGLYFVAVGDSQEKTSIDFFDFKTRKRTTLVRLGKLWWYGMALSPDQKSLLYSVVDNAGSNLMLVDRFQ